jgi:hypothetical protein
MVPRISSVGSGPKEKIILRIEDATNVRTPDSRGRVITMAIDTNITAQIKPDKCCPNSRRKKKQHVIMDSIDFIQRRCYNDGTKCNQQKMVTKISVYSRCTLHNDANL